MHSGRRAQLENEHAATWADNGVGQLRFGVLAVTAEPPPLLAAVGAGKVPAGDAAVGGAAAAAAGEYLRVTVDVRPNGPGQHDEWAGLDYLPADLPEG